MPKYHRGAAPDAIAPDGVEIRDLVDEPQGAHTLSVAEGSIKCGERSAKVYHPVDEKIWYFLRGSGVFHLHRPGVVEEEVIPVGPGENQLVFLLCGSPAWGKGQEVRPWPPDAETVS
jgi:hypothetical protein